MQEPKDKDAVVAIEQALSELTNFDFDRLVDGACEDPADGGEDTEAPAGPDDLPVGGCVSDPVGGEQRAAGEVEDGLR